MRERQSQRTKSRAEVFTPSWLCNQMNNDIDAEWFGSRDVFNSEEGRSWIPNLESVAFPKKKGRGWQAYVGQPQARDNLRRGAVRLLPLRHRYGTSAPP